jgi:hypothetical protein
VYSPTNYNQWVWPAALESGAQGFIINWRDKVYTDKCATNLRTCRAITVDDVGKCDWFGKLVEQMPAQPKLGEYLKRVSTDFDKKLFANWQRCAQKAQPICGATVKSALGSIDAKNTLAVSIKGNAAAYANVKKACGW